MVLRRRPAAWRGGSVGRGERRVGARLSALAALAVSAFGLALVACNDAGEPDTGGPGRDAAVVASIIRDVALSDTTPDPDDPDAVPVVFVVAADGASIPIAVQAEVASVLADDADVRFADARSEAIDEAEEGAPVRAGGVLLAVGELPDEEDDAIDVPVERYVSIDDHVDLVVSVRWDEPEWVVSSTVVVPDPAG